MRKLNLKRYGVVNGEILWISADRLVKITFKYGLFKRKMAEIFHYTEILNFDEIYLDSKFNLMVI